MPARFLIRAVPRSLRTALSDRRDVTATLVVTRILLSADVVCGAVHSEIYSSHSELELFSNRLQICSIQFIYKFKLSQNHIKEQHDLQTKTELPAPTEEGGQYYEHNS